MGRRMIWVDRALGEGSPQRGLEIVTDILDLSEADFAILAGVSKRTVRRWFHEVDRLPGPVCAMLDAWRRCKEAGIKPMNSIQQFPKDKHADKAES